MTEELDKAVELLRNSGHSIGRPYVDASGHLFMVINNVAMKPGDAIRLAKGDVTFEELKQGTVTGLDSGIRPTGFTLIGIDQMEYSIVRRRLQRVGVIPLLRKLQEIGSLTAAI